MFKGEYQGTKVDELSKKILVLGESHHSSDENDDFTTNWVITTNYRNSPKESKYQFFHKIAQSFNIDTDDINDEFSEFWDYVYFGNYIGKLCGIKDRRAKKFLGEIINFLTL